MSEQFIEANGNDPKRIFAITMLQQIARESGLVEQISIDSFISNAIQDTAEKLGRSTYGTPLSAAIDIMWKSESNMRFQKERETALRRKHDRIRKVVIDATVEHSGCTSGKLEFLEECLIFPGDEDFPTKTYFVTRTETQEIEVPCIDQDMDIQSDFIGDWIDDNVEWNTYDAEIKIEAS